MIVPALLTSDPAELKRMSETCARFTDYVQVDIMDGHFVPSTSVTEQQLSAMVLPTAHETHLMVRDPLKWIDACIRAGAKKIIFHAEIQGDLASVAGEIARRGAEPGIALNPDTSADRIVCCREAITTVLCMAVHPGFYGAPFIPEVLNKIRAAKKMFPYLQIGIDGGVKKQNIRAVAASGADFICVGSAILKQDDPAAAYQSLSALINE
ncbi:MAG: ribulose-phosphate 3-epimerase [Candidatus Omnitrophica bacterium]|nr:ribulose-phosphate 3-epimerase [Candidatus Omnitrophota bacterium]